MNLNDIHLSPQQLAGLYGSSLVELASSTAPMAPAAPPPAATPGAAPAAKQAPAPAVATAFLGQNQKGILVVTADPAAAYLADADLVFLTNVLGACNLGLADVAIVNWAHLDSPGGDALSAELAAKQVLLFGVTPDAFGLPVVFPPFQVQALAGRTYMQAPPLAAISADISQKKALWMALKKMFAV
ncbi:MAG: hypothetical protein EOO11_05920 [Chitinophagaceae bacterium]|nr:MAG: hypothetical protein EOO11_05920 [Chitinophagaceae bacterium]